MAVYRAVDDGNWNNLAIWQDNATGSFVGSTVLPGTSDDVYSNNRTIQVNQTVSVKSIHSHSSTNISNGGQFVISSNVNLTTVDGVFGNNANAAGTINGACVYISAVCTTVLTTNFTGGVGQGGHGLGIAAAATVTIIGNITNGTTLAYGAWNNSTGTITITGNQTGAGAAGLVNTGAATITITGNQIGGPLAAGYGISNSNGTLKITGNQTANGSPGIYNTASGVTHEITGIATSTAAAYAIQNTQNTTIISYTGVCINYQAVPAIYSPRLYIKVVPTSERRFSDIDGNTNSLYAANNIYGMPTEANVRYGTTYGPALEFTGQIKVPSPSNVASGVPTDNTVGTADFALTDLLTAIGVVNVGVQKASLLIPHTTNI